MLNSLSVWRDSFEAYLLPVADATWADNLADWVESESTDLLELVTYTNSAFVFDKATFKAQLLATVVPWDNQAVALQRFVDAWGLAIQNSVMTITGGAGAGFSDIQASGTPSNVATVKTQLQVDLLLGVNTADIDTSQFPPAFRDAFLALTFAMSGDAINPSPPPARIPFGATDGVQ